MATTKNGRIRKLIEANLKRPPSEEQKKPHFSRTMEHTISKKNPETGEIMKSRVSITVIDNTYQRNERRKTEIERLMNALGDSKPNSKTGGVYYDSPLKKTRMRKFAHKKQKTAEDKPKKGGKG